MKLTLRLKKNLMTLDFNEKVLQENMDNLTNILPTNDPMTQWPNDPMTQWPNDPMTQWPNDPMTQWPNDPMTQWPNDPMTQMICQPNKWSDSKYGGYLNNSIEKNNFISGLGMGNAHRVNSLDNLYNAIHYLNSY